MILIVAGGETPSITRLRQEAAQASRIIAADRGASYCLKAGILPALVIGDLDSLPVQAVAELERRNVSIKRLDRHKDVTDTQAALSEALRLGDPEITIMAGTGSRFDHGLANVHLLRLALDAGVKARLVTRNQDIFLVQGKYPLAGARGLTLSLLPLDAVATGITLSGFEYELRDATMKLGEPYGVSNIVTADPACIVVGQGTLIAFLMQRGRRP